MEKLNIIHSLSPLLKSLNSFRNLYNAVLRCVEQDSRKARLLSPVLGLTMNSTRHRIRNPQLWQVSEIEKLAVYYKLPTTACVQLQETISSLGIFLGQLPDTQRKQIEKVCQLKTGQFIKRQEVNRSVIEIEKLHQGLNNWLVTS